MTSVSGISSATQTDQTEFTKKMSQGKKDFQSLQDAVASGDLDGARSALESMKKNMPSGAPPDESGGSAEQGKSDLESGFAALEKALGSNDTAAAQKALETIKSNMKQGQVELNVSLSLTATVTKSESADGVGEQIDLLA